MKRIFIFALALFGLVTCFNLTAQETNAPVEDNAEESSMSPEENPSGGPPQESVVRDGAYDKIGVKEKVALGYDHIREADVFWSKRIWRVIDTREKMNLSFGYPKDPFISVLMNICSTEDVNLFEDEEFLTELTWTDVEESLSSVDSVEVMDPETYEYVWEVVRNDFDPAKITKFRLKEDWIFDEETSSMITRILGIAPIQDVYDDESGTYLGQEVMFWAYYPTLRDHLVHYEAFNPFNEAIRMTWEDIFEARFFSSYIMKESNSQDRRISDYATGKRALLESDRIKRQMFEFEHDLWEY